MKQKNENEIILKQWIRVFLLIAVIESSSSLRTLSLAVCLSLAAALFSELEETHRVPQTPIAAPRRAATPEIADGTQSKEEELSETI